MEVEAWKTAAFARKEYLLSQYRAMNVTPTEQPLDFSRTNKETTPPRTIPNGHCPLPVSAQNGHNSSLSRQNSRNSPIPVSAQNGLSPISVKSENSPPIASAQNGHSLIPLSCQNSHNSSPTASALSPPIMPSQNGHNSPLPIPSQNGYNSPLPVPEGLASRLEQASWKNASPNNRLPRFEPSSSPMEEDVPKMSLLPVMPPLVSPEMLFNSSLALGGPLLPPFGLTSMTDNKSDESIKHQRPFKAYQHELLADDHRPFGYLPTDQSQQRHCLSRSSSSGSSTCGGPEVSSTLQGADLMKRQNSSDAEDKNRITRRPPKHQDDSNKDDAYWERRRKNNEAAKRSRDARRRKEDAIATRAKELLDRNRQMTSAFGFQQQQIQWLKTQNVALGEKYAETQLQMKEMKDFLKKVLQYVEGCPRCSSNKEIC